MIDYPFVLLLVNKMTLIIYHATFFGITVASKAHQPLDSVM